MRLISMAKSNVSIKDIEEQGSQTEGDITPGSVGMLLNYSELYERALEELASTYGNSLLM